MNNVSVGIICSVVGALIGALGFIRYAKKDVQEETGSFTRVETKLDYVSKGVDDIRLDIRDHNRQISDITTRLTRVEESAKSAHHRIDGLEREE